MNEGSEGQTATQRRRQNSTKTERDGGAKTRRGGGKGARETRMDDLVLARVETEGIPEADWADERARKLDKLLSSLEAKLLEGDFKATVGDFIRLLQVRKELEEERPRGITATWVEPSEGGCGSGG